MNEFFSILWDISVTDNALCPPPLLKSNTYTCGITSNKIEGKALSHITFANGSIDFSYADRMDGGGLALNGIYLKNNQGQIVRQMSLVQDYFLSTDVNDAFLRGEKKLILDSTLQYRLYLKEC